MSTEYKRKYAMQYQSMIMQLSEIIIVKTKVQNSNTPLNNNRTSNV